jgi:hypothetical protein
MVKIKTLGKKIGVQQRNTGAMRTIVNAVSVKTRKTRCLRHRKGNIMPNNLASKEIELLLAEADELIQQINSDVINDMQEEHRLQFEKHAHNLKKIKSEVQGKLEKRKTSKIGTGSEGMHEAIQDIVKAMRDLTKYLS